MYAVAFRASQFWQKVPVAIKDSLSLEILQSKNKALELWRLPV